MKTKTFYNIIYFITIIFFIFILYFILSNNPEPIIYKDEEIKETDDNIKILNKIQKKEIKELKELDDINSYDDKEVKFNNVYDNDNINIQDNSIYVNNENYVNELIKNKNKSTLDNLDNQFYNFKKNVPIDKCKYNYNISKDQKTDLPISNVPYKFLLNNKTMKISDNFQ